MRKIQQQNVQSPAEISREKPQPFDKVRQICDERCVRRRGRTAKLPSYAVESAAKFERGSTESREQRWKAGDLSR